MSQQGHPHHITIEPHPKRVKVYCNGASVADSKRTLVLREGPLPPALYFPREDVQMERLQPTTHSTHCPFKGDAAYYSIKADNAMVENAIWTYESPISAVQQIKGFLAFDREKVEVTEEEV